MHLKFVYFFATQVDSFNPFDVRMILPSSDEQLEKEKKKESDRERERERTVIQHQLFCCFLCRGNTKTTRQEDRDERKVNYVI